MPPRLLKLTAVADSAADVAAESVTVVPLIAEMVVPLTIPAPETGMPTAKPVALATVRLVAPLAAVPVVATLVPIANALVPVTRIPPPAAPKVRSNPAKPSVALVVVTVGILSVPKVVAPERVWLAGSR